MTDIHWTKEDHGIPHKNGHVRFYLVGFDDDVFGYLGWFDMNDCNSICIANLTDEVFDLVDSCC